MHAENRKEKKAADFSSKHIIIAAYYFPPLGLAGTARPVALANYFAERGHVVTVLTVKSIDYPVHDESQLKKLHHKVSVVRSGSADPARIAKIVPVLPKVKQIRKMAKNAAESTLFPDSKIGFVQSAGRILRQILREDRENILITTSPPMSIHQLGMDAREGMEFLWVADFRDVWTSLPEADQSAEFKMKARDYRREIVKQADLVTATSPRTVELLRENGARNSRVMFNGFAECDFEARPPKRVRAFGLYGTLNNLVGVEKLFDWFGCWRSKRENGIKLRHIGYVDLPELDEMLGNFNLDESFLTTGYLPHDQSLMEIRRHHTNVLMLSDQVDISYVVPSKLFELLRAEPPLIVILPERNAARELLEELKLTDVYVVDSYEDFRKAADACMEKKRDRKNVVPEEVMRFTWENQISVLESALKTIP